MAWVLALACGLLSTGAHAATNSAPPASAAARSAGNAGLPMEIEADAMGGQQDREIKASGGVALRQGNLSLRAREVSHDLQSKRLIAQGDVRIDRDADWFTGPLLDLNTDEYTGFMLTPAYYFSRSGGGGRASRIDFLGEKKSRLTKADYTTCDRSGGGAPAWLLSSDEVTIDFDANEGRARGAVLRFLDVPILALPALTFPVSSERKSGWLPPTVNLDTKSGLDVAAPYYWNIAPNRDATLTPSVISRRGVALGTEFRYLETWGGPQQGEVQVDVLPGDRVAGRDRGALHWRHRGQWGDVFTVQALLNRVSDDDYWKDFPRSLQQQLMPRLLPTDVKASARWNWSGLEGESYARVQRWQVLQDRNPSAAIVPPYQRVPQLGARMEGDLSLGLQLNTEVEFNRFELARGLFDTGGTALMAESGERVHVLGRLSRPWRSAAAWLTPALDLNAAAYRNESAAAPFSVGSTRQRAVPTFSLDGGLSFERAVSWLGRDLRQSLEPRLLFVRTPFRDQSGLPNYDAAGQDFNAVSIFSPNAFSGIDRVSDARQVTAGLSSRVIETATGAELLSFGIAQRYQFADQRLTPLGVPDTQRGSDVLVYGASRLSSQWGLDGTAQYSPQLDRTVRSVLLARYSPGAFRTVSMGYRYTRLQSELLELGWQWPLWGQAPAQPLSHRDTTVPHSAGTCKGTLYSVGRVNYSQRERRVSDALLGMEYDAGCWIGRVVARRLSTGLQEATTRLLFEVELVGFSRLGTNPLQVLKDNIPGYRLLREDPKPAPPVRP